MYLLSCPNCQAEISVTPAQAGDRLTCPKCQAAIQVPKLGELKTLPQRQTPETAADAAQSQRSVGGSIAFVVLSLFAVGLLLAAGYNAVRWATIQTEMTTESHLESIQTIYGEAEPAIMVVEFEDMERRSLDLVVPYEYQTINDEKAKWGWNALVSLGISVACGIGAIVAGSAGDRRIR